MNRPDQSARNSSGSERSRTSHHSSTNTNNRNRYQNSNDQDDERQYTRKSSKTSARTPGPGERIGPPLNSSTSATSYASQAHSRPAPSSSSQPWTSNASEPRNTKQAASRPALPTRPVQQTTINRPPINFDRSNPTAPTWDTGPSRHARPTNLQNTAQINNAGYARAAPALRIPGRKAASTAPPMWDPANEPRTLNIGRMTATPKKRPQIHINKSTNLPMPFWKHQDADHEARQKTERRMNRRGELGYGTPSAQMSTQTAPPPRSYLGPGFRVIQVQDSDSDSDEEGSPMDIDEVPEKRLSLKTISQNPTRSLTKDTKAARKTKYIPVSPDGSSPSASSSSVESESDSVVDLTDTESDEGPKGYDERDPFSENEIVIIEPPQPVITIPLPQITPVLPQPPSPRKGPPDRLVAALEEVSMASVRMQKTGQLPFLRRNLRRGFRIRCNAAGIKITKSKPKMPILVRYQFTDSTYETYASRWVCPLCELHGALPNKEMLRCHIHWDHSEIVLERWEQRTNNKGKPEWWIRILIPEVIEETSHLRVYDFIPEDVVTKVEPGEIPLGVLSETLSSGPTLGGRASFSPTPPRSAAEVTPTPTASPPRSPSQRLPDQEPLQHTDEDATSEIKSRIFKETIPLESVALKSSYLERDEESQRARSVSTNAWSSRSRSVVTSATERTEQSLSTIRLEHTPGPAGGLYPSPPPAQDSLGPAAQPPYLPAKSEYDGPDIYFSCRPAGPSLFDLLGTLPMEPFGVLDWTVLDREEEIFESDDVKDEHKIMHALWARWITLNRNQFIANYYKGTVAFVDMYWRMIHQAAGWSALRYWLLLLLSHRFLTGREVAKILRHYEDLTGMPYW